MKAQLLLLLLLSSTVLALSCQTYLEDLAQLYNTDKEEFAKEVHGYVAFSGKIVDDLGLPNSCVKNSTYHYFTGKIDAAGEENDYIAYLGLCFSAICSTADMDRNGAFIVNTLLNITAFESSSISFSQPELESQISAGAVVFITLFAILIAIGLKQSVVGMFVGCQKEGGNDDEELVSKYAVQYMDDYDPTLLVINQKEGFFKKHCLVAKFTEYWVPEESTKIIPFSAIRILSLPLALYGYLFYLCNYGSYNYFSFNEEIYQETFSKIALTAYYLPDILFFISGYLFASKALVIVDLESRPWKSLMSLFSRKFVRLYVLYLVFVVIYWQISPSLHGGPVWSEYEAEAAQCSSSWWRVFLLIDNWFDQGCYNFAWFIPAELQLALINIALLLLYARNRKLGHISLALSLVSSWILVLTISSPLPSSLETTLDYDAEQYFKSTYSHLPFYLLGVNNAHLAHNETTKAFLSNFAQNKILRVIGLFVGSFFIFLVTWRPELWDAVLGLELGLARTGMFIGIYLIIFGGMFGGRTQKTLIHRFSSLSLGALLIGGIVVSSSFWCNFSFPYLDGQFLLTETIPNTIISSVVGGFILILILPKPPKQEETLL